MMTFVLHWGFELAGSGAWACARGRCTHRHHRIIGDAVLTGIFALILVHVGG